MGLIKAEVSSYKEAIQYCEQAISIQENTRLTNASTLATSYDKFGIACMKMGEYSRALDYCNRAVSIQKKTCPRVHPDVAQSYENLDGVSQGLKKYAEALSYFETALDIYQHCLTVRHNRIESVMKSIEKVKRKM